MDKFSEFVHVHGNDDVGELLLHKDKRQDIDLNLAASTIQGRRKMVAKAPSWYACTGIIYPTKLAVEQCSSEAAAALKTEIILQSCKNGGFAGKIGRKDAEKLKIADLTGGLGMDSWAFSRVCRQVLYVEMDEELAEAAKHNFKALGCGNITVVNANVNQDSLSRPGGIGEIVKTFVPDIIYLDPARRSESGKKVFRLEDCKPDILKIKDLLLNICGCLVIKLSPMADINALLGSLGKCCKRVDIISIGGECKEILVSMERDYDGDCLICVDCGRVGTFQFYREEENYAKSNLLVGNSLADILEGKILLEPDKALMKAGAFKLVSQRFGITKLDVSTHYYVLDSNTAFYEDTAIDNDTVPQCGIAALQALFKRFRILEVLPLNKNSMRAAAQGFPCTGVTVRNIPMSSEQLRKRLNVGEGEKIHIFGLKVSDKNCLIIAEKIM